MRFISLLVRFFHASLVMLPVAGWSAPISADIERNVNLAIGQRNFGPIAIPDDVARCVVSVERAQWTNSAAKLAATIILTGDPYPAELPKVQQVCALPCLYGFTAEGGQSDQQATLSVMLPNTTNRKVQGNYVVSGARFRSTITVACQ